MPHPSDLELAEFLRRCDAELLGVVVHALHSVVSYDSHKYFGDILDGKVEVVPARTSERDELVSQILTQLSYFGSNSLAYAMRKLSPLHDEPGVAYNELLVDAHVVIAKQFAPKASVPPLDTIRNREAEIAKMLMNRAVENIPDDELVQMLRETGMSRKAALQQLKELRNPALGAGALMSAGSILGKKFMRDFMLAALTAYVAKAATKEGAKELAIQLMKKLPQKMFLRVSNYIGWALLAWDGYKLSGPAMRVTVPTVATLSVLRTIDRLREPDTQ